MGSKRTGQESRSRRRPLFQRMDVQHLIEPRSVVPESVMPSYAFLKDTPLEVKEMLP
ncbi:hypothetical protein F2981_28905 (plasmid) [Sinorhizobium meliloti]|nr:hypothetical protein [Sinorhizobium meliloti]